MDYINSLPQPFLAEIIGGGTWGVYDIDVQTGLMRVNVMGMLDHLSIADIRKFTDAAGVDHDPETFYIDWDTEQHVGNS
jgi:hypothetical protein